MKPLLLNKWRLAGYPMSFTMGTTKTRGINSPAATPERQYQNEGEAAPHHGSFLPEAVAHGRFVALALALVTLLAYSPVMRHGFAGLDDDLFVTNNLLVQKGLTWKGVTWALTTFHESMWHPVTWLSHMLDCELFGLDPRGHHLTNVFLHMVNAVLLLWLLRRLTGNLWASAVVAALFAWHPLNVESVAWIAERKNVLSTCFGLLSLIAYTGYAQKRLRVQRAAGSSPWAYDYALALFFFALCLMAKTMLVALPCVMLLLDYWPLQRLSPSGFSLRHFLGLALEKWPFFLLVVPACVLTVLAESHGGLVAPWDQLPLNIRVCSAFRSYTLYLWKAMWPLDLAILYPYAPRAHLALVGALAAAFLVMVTVLVLRLRRRYPYLLVGWLWFLGTLVPVIGFVQIGKQSMNDHHAYVPLIGIFIALVFLAKDLLGRYRMRPFMPTIVACVLLGGCLFATERQIGFWRDNETLFSHALAITMNNGPAHNHLGVELAKQGRLAEARTNFEEAIRLEPRWADPYNNLGNLLRYTGRPEEALGPLEQAVTLKPNQATMRSNLGEVLGELGQFDEAMAELQLAAKLNPWSGWPNYQMGRIRLRQGRDKEALAELHEALRLQPNNPVILALTARLLSADEDASVRDGKSAVKLALRSCAAAPGQPANLDVLGMAFAELGDFEKAQMAASNAVAFAQAMKRADYEFWNQRLELYKRHQPWRESFTNSFGSGTSRKN